MSREVETSTNEIRLGKQNKKILFNLNVNFVVTNDTEVERGNRKI